MLEDCYQKGHPNGSGSGQGLGSRSIRHLPNAEIQDENARGRGYASWTSFWRSRTWSLSLGLPSQRLVMGLGRVGKESGLMVCMELGRNRSSTQAPGTAGLAGPACCELRDAGMQWPARDTSAAGYASLDCRVVGPSDFKQFLVERAKLLRWKKKQIDEMESGAWFQPIRTFVKGEVPPRVGARMEKLCQALGR